MVVEDNAKPMAPRGPVSAREVLEMSMLPAFIQQKICVPWAMVVR